MEHRRRNKRHKPAQTKALNSKFLMDGANIAQTNLRLVQKGIKRRDKRKKTKALGFDLNFDMSGAGDLFGEP